MSKAHNSDSSIDKPLFGFWVYLMTDLMLFSALFASFIVLRNNTFGGPGGKEIFDMPYVLVQTAALLVSSFTAGLGILSARAGNKKLVYRFFTITFALGLLFIGMEISEFDKLVSEGNSWRESGFLSAFFTLVGTHGLHITSGLLWMAILIWRTSKEGLTKTNVKRLILMSYFWHFLDIVWIFIFTIVYLFGAAGL